MHERILLKIYFHKCTCFCSRQQERQVQEDCWRQSKQQPHGASFDKSRMVASRQPMSLHSLHQWAVMGSQAEVMTRPASTFACCTCPEAIQRKPCKHHIAWLLAQALDNCQPEAVRVVVQMLGTHFGFASGCTMKDTSNIVHSLQDLHGWSCARWLQAQTRQATMHQAWPGQKNARVNSEKAGPSNPTPPGAVGVQNHMSEMLQMVNAQHKLLLNLQIAQAEPCK
jgi:hypothetical protein